MITKVNKKRKSVMFNNEQLLLYSRLGLSKPFEDFVRDSFYNAIDDLREKKGVSSE